MRTPEWSVPVNQLVDQDPQRPPVHLWPMPRGIDDLGSEVFFGPDKRVRTRLGLSYELVRDGVGFPLKTSAGPVNRRDMKIV